MRGCCPDQPTHYKSVTISWPSAKSQQDRREARDMDAYARLRENGVQPKTIDGSAELERGASTVHEIENKNIITDPRLRQRVTNAFESAKDLAVKPLGGDDAA